MNVLELFYLLNLAVFALATLYLRASGQHWHSTTNSQLYLSGQCFPGFHGNTDLPLLFPPASTNKHSQETKA